MRAALIGLWVFAASISWAVDASRELTPGQRYDGGTVVHDSRRGVSFRLPPDWAGHIPQGSDALLLNASGQDGVGIVAILDQMTPELLAERLSEPQDFGGSVILQLSRPLEQDGTRWKAAYLSGNVVGRALALLGPDEQAVVYFFAGPRAEGHVYDQLLDNLARTTEFESVTTL